MLLWYKRMRAGRGVCRRAVVKVHKIDMPFLFISDEVFGNARKGLANCKTARYTKVTRFGNVSKYFVKLNHSCKLT